MKGMPLSVYYDCANRHLEAWWNDDQNEDHAAAVVWNMLCAMWTEANADIVLLNNGDVLDDRHKFPRSLLWVKRKRRKSNYHQLANSF